MEKLLALSGKHRVGAAALLTAGFMGLFYPLFFLLLGWSHIASGVFAISTALGLSSIRAKGYFYTVLRWLSIPAFGGAILSRSEMWVQEAFSNFLVLLKFEEEVGMRDRLAVSDHWPIVALFGFTFVCYYLNVERWPKRRPPRTNPRNAAALCAATQTVIVVTVAIPSILTITLSMLLAGVVATMMLKNFGPMNMMFFLIAPFYALANDTVAVLLFMVSSIVVLFLLQVYKIKENHNGIVYGGLFMLVFAPLCYLHNAATVLQLVTLVLLGGFALFFQRRSPLPNTVAVELMAVSIGVWFLVLSFPQKPLLVVAGILLIGSPLLTSFRRDLHKPLRLYLKWTYLWLLYVVALPLLPLEVALYLGFFTPFIVGLIVITIFVIYDNIPNLRRLVNTIN